MARNRLVIFVGLIVGLVLVGCSTADIDVAQKGEAPIGDPITLTVETFDACKSDATTTRTIEWSKTFTATVSLDVSIETGVNAGVYQAKVAAEYGLEHGEQARSGGSVSVEVPGRAHTEFEVLGRASEATGFVVDGGERVAAFTLPTGFTFSGTRLTDFPCDNGSTTTTSTAVVPLQVLDEPFVVRLQREDGFFQRGFVTPGGFIVTPTQANLGSEVAVTWMERGLPFEATAAFVRVGDLDPEVSLYTTIAGSELPKVDFGMQNASSLSVLTAIEGWLSQRSQTPGEVVQPSGAVQIPDYVAGSEVGLRMNEFGRSFLLCALTSQGNIGADEVCQGVADSFNGQVNVEFVGLESDPPAIANTFTAIFASAPTIDAIVTTSPTGAIAAAEAAQIAGFSSISIATVGGLTPGLASAIADGTIDLFVPSIFDGAILETTLVTTAGDMGMPIRLRDAGPVVGMAIAQSTNADRTYSIPIETMRDNFPEAFG